MALIVRMVELARIARSRVQQVDTVKIVRKKCSCSPAKVCNRFTGHCECKPGWYGKECEKICPVGLYGLNCKYTCSCLNCRPTDGYCCQKNSRGGCDQCMYGILVITVIYCKQRCLV